MVLAMLLGACTGAGEPAGPEKQPQGPAFEAPGPGEYDSVDTAIITRINKINNTISFYNYELSKNYTLNYDSVSEYKNKYGTALSIDQLTEGTLADISFLKSKKLLVNLQEAADAFVMDEITDFSVDAAGKTLNYKSESYKLTASTLLLGADDEDTINDLNKFDYVKLVGKDTTVMAIILEKGHGYISFKGADYFTDGLLEVGKLCSEKITKNFRMAVPEGNNDITITKNLTTVNRVVKVERGKETVIDLSDVEIEELKTGKVLFDVKPSDASVYIDGVLIDNTRLYEYSYGMHKMIASAEGYQTTTRYFNVGEEMASLPIVLEPDKDSDDKREEEEDKTEGYFIFITAPNGVEVSFDGNYIGMTPLSVKKKVGNHTIGLRKNGYISRTYNILIENTSGDVYYTFEDLEIQKETTPATSTENPSDSSTESSQKTDTSETAESP